MTSATLETPQPPQAPRGRRRVWEYLPCGSQALWDQTSGKPVDLPRYAHSHRQSYPHTGQVSKEVTFSHLDSTRPPNWLGFRCLASLVSVSSSPRPYPIDFLTEGPCLISLCGSTNIGFLRGDCAHQWWHCWKENYTEFCLCKSLWRLQSWIDRWTRVFHSLLSITPFYH